MSLFQSESFRVKSHVVWLAFYFLGVQRKRQRATSGEQRAEERETELVSNMLSLRIHRSKDLRRTSSCSSLLKNRNHEVTEGLFHKCFPLNLVYKNKKNSVPLVIFQPVPEGVEHISELIDSKCTFCHENCEKVHRDGMRLNIVSRGT